jgi:hypothetical protein
VRAAAVLVALAACGGKAAPAAAPVEQPAPAAESAFQFDWGIPCKVPVAERGVRKGTDFALRYVVSVTRMSDDELMVDMIDVEPVMYRELYAAFPAVIVDNAGNYLRTESVDEIIALTIEMNPELAGGYDSPELRAQMAAKFAEPWAVWVANWIDWSLTPGEQATVELTAPTPSGAEVPFEGKVEYVRLERDVAHLRYTERMDGATLKAMMEPMLRSLTAVAPDPAEADRFFQEMKLEGYRETITEVETSPANLRPRRARHEMRFEATLNGEPMGSEVEWREFQFDWDRAVGCGR